MNIQKTSSIGSTKSVIEIKNYNNKKVLYLPWDPSKAFVPLSKDKERYVKFEKMILFNSSWINEVSKKTTSVFLGLFFDTLAIGETVDAYLNKVSLCFPAYIEYIKNLKNGKYYEKNLIYLFGLGCSHAKQFILEKCLHEIIANCSFETCMKCLEKEGKFFGELYLLAEKVKRTDLMAECLHRINIEKDEKTLINCFKGIEVHSNKDLEWELMCILHKNRDTMINLHEKYFYVMNTLSLYGIIPFSEWDEKEKRINRKCKIEKANWSQLPFYALVAILEKYSLNEVIIEASIVDKCIEFLKDCFSNPNADDKTNLIVVFKDFTGIDKVTIG